MKCNALGIMEEGQLLDVNARLLKIFADLPRFQALFGQISSKLANLIV